MFSKAKTGDKVWEYTLGWGVIYQIDTESGFPIRVKFDNLCEDVEVTYTLGGYKCTYDLNPSLFWGEIKFDVPKKPLPDLKVDTKVLVWDSDSSHKCRRYFSHFDAKGDLFCFHSGTTSWISNKNIGTTSWKNWEVVDEN